MTARRFALFGLPVLVLLLAPRTGHATTLRSSYYDGTTYLTEPRLPGLPLTAFTIEGWVYRQGFRAETLFLCGDWHVYVQGNALYFNGLHASVPVTQSSWTHVAVSVSGGVASIYVNGQLAAQDVPPEGSTALHRGFLGFQDEWRLWNVARTATQIRAGMYQELNNSNVVDRWSNGRASNGPHTVDASFGLLPVRLEVPDSPLARLDGIIDLDGAYKGAEQLVFSYQNGVHASDGVAYLVHNADGVFVGIPATSFYTDADQSIGSYIQIGIDVNGAGGTTPGASHKLIRVPITSVQPLPITQMPADGAGGYRTCILPPNPTSQQIIQYGACVFAAGNPVQVVRRVSSSNDSVSARGDYEFFIPKALLGDFDQVDGITVGTFAAGSPGESWAAPHGALVGQPAGWAPMAYGGAIDGVAYANLSMTVSEGYDGGSTTPRAGKPVELRAMTSSGAVVLARRTLSAQGSADFLGVPVSPDVPLALVAPPCANCTTTQRAVADGKIAPSQLDAFGASFPGCALGPAPCSYQRVLFFQKEAIGPIVLAAAEPGLIEPRVQVRQSPDVYTGANPTSVLRGANLHPRVEVYLYPSDAGFPRVLDGAQFVPLPDSHSLRANVRSVALDGTSMVVETPPFNPGLSQRWTWVIVDTWVRPGYTPRVGTQVTSTEPTYPEVWGFDFQNPSEVQGALHDIRYEGSFDAAYGDNATICMGLTCVCPVPDPRYVVWRYAFYPMRQAMTGNCTGMASTSLRMYSGNMDPKRFDPEHVRLPQGYDVRYWNQHADYNHNWCSPDEPLTLKANIETNQNKMVSDDMLDETLDDLDGGPTYSFDVINGDPLHQVYTLQSQALPAMLCMLPASLPDMGHAHCVVAYAVSDEGDDYRIRIWNNNTPYDYLQAPDSDQNLAAVAEAVIVHKATNSYEFLSDPVLHGSRLLTPDISVYEGYVHAPGLVSLYKYGWAYVFGSAQGVYADRSGNLFGTTPDGVVHEDFPGAGFAPIPDLGDAQPVLLPYGPGVAPRVDVYQRGGSSTFYLASSGRQIQAASTGAHAGDKDVIDVREATAGDLTGFKYKAQSTGTQVSPTLGLPLGDRQVATFRWTPLALGAGQDIEVGMDPANKRTTLTNRSGGTRAYTLFVNAVDGPSSQQGIWVYSGLGIAQGATQRTTLSTWPDAGHLQLATDANGDGTFESTTTVTGTRCDTAPNDCNFNRVSDLCDIAMGDSLDANHDHVPDECPVVQ